MGHWMTDNCTVVRHNERLEETLAQCQEWKERYKNVKLSDTGMWTNQNLSFARAIKRYDPAWPRRSSKAHCLRNESRGAHYKPAFPDRDDANFLKATIAAFNPKTNSAEISYTPVDTTLVPARPRNYGKKKNDPTSTGQPNSRRVG